MELRYFFQRLDHHLLLVELAFEDDRHVIAEEGLRADHAPVGALDRASGREAHHTLLKSHDFRRLPGS